MAVGTVGWGRMRWGSERSFPALVILRALGPALSQQSQRCGQRDAECRALPLLQALADGTLGHPEHLASSHGVGQCGAAAGGLLCELELIVGDHKSD